MITEHNFEAPFELESSNDEEVMLWVFYEYSPLSPQTQTDPEWPAEIDMLGIKINGDYCIDWDKAFSDSELKAIKMLCWDDTEKRLANDE